VCYENRVYRMNVINNTVHECASCPVTAEHSGYAFSCNLSGLAGESSEPSLLLDVCMYVCMYVPTGILFVGGRVDISVSLPAGRYGQQMYHYDPIDNVWTLLYWQLPFIDPHTLCPEGSFVFYEPYLIFLGGHKALWIADLSIIGHYQVKFSLSTAHNNMSTPIASVDDVPDTSSTFVPKYNDFIIANARVHGITATAAWTQMNIENIIQSSDYKKTIYYQGDHPRGDQWKFVIP
jgi:hypothetical protein